MRIGLFIPCYVDQFYPRVAVATLELLEKLGHKVIYPGNQTCCGQPLANAGYQRYGKQLAQLYVEQFSAVDIVVAPSGSCVHHVREHFVQSKEAAHICKNTVEVCQFLSEYALLDSLAPFPYKVGLHQSCHGLRGLHLGKPSETVGKPFSVVGQLLEKVPGIQMVYLGRPDECCGFGGTFAVSQEAVSVKMGKDRVQDHLLNGAEVIAGTDMSCLMHMEGIIRRKELPLKTIHVVEILNQTMI